METNDIFFLAAMAALAVVAAGAFVSITGYLFARGLADRNQPAPNILDFYRAYRAHTLKTTGRIGRAFWVHIIAVALFITLGVGYTIARMLSRLM